MRPEIPVWLEEIGERLSRNDPHLTSLELAHQRMDDAQGRFLADRLEENDTVTFIMISCYNMTDDGPMALARAISRSEAIDRIHLRDLRISKDASIFFEAISSMRQLKELSLRHCTLDSKSSKCLGELLGSPATEMQEFRLVDSKLDQPSTCLSPICLGIRNNLHLQRIYLINTELEGEYSGRCIGSTMLCNNASLKELYLCENMLGDEGVAQLAHALLHENSSLQVLDLRSNNMELEGTISLSELLKGSTTLRRICLGGNHIGNDGVKVLAGGLSSNTALRQLDLQGTGIGPTGAQSISEMLAENQNLHELNLSFNYLGDQGVTAIAKVLSINTTLRKLSLRRTNMSNCGANTLARQLPFMRGLQDLILIRNRIDMEGIRTLSEGLRANMELEYLHVDEKVSEPVLREIIYWIRLNRAGRRVVRDTQFPINLWPDLLSHSNIRSNPDVMHYFMSEKPDLLEYSMGLRRLR